jgi:general secretion pathway protein N
MLRALAYALVALLAALATAAALAPAQWMAAAVRSVSNGQVDLAGAEGTLWSGRGIVVVGTGREAVRASIAEPFSWNLSPWPLLAGVIHLTLSHPSALAQPLTLRATFARRLDVGPVTARLPASLLAGLGAPWNTIRPGGMLVLSWDRIHVDAGRMLGDVSAEWLFAASALTPVSPFGHYRLQARGGYPGTRLTLQTISGPLEMTGDGTIAEGGQLRFKGMARPVPGADPAIKAQLAGLIALLGRREGDAAIFSFGNLREQ